jgi:RNA polymerase sigma-70 factor (ECF subfamily)
VALTPDAWLIPAAPLAPGEAQARAAEPPVERSLGREQGREQAREQATLAALYAEHAPSILRFLRGLLGDRAAAADATQETFARAFRKLHTLREDDRIAPWLFGIARNVSLEQRRARRRGARILTPALEEDSADSESNADDRTPETELLGREAAQVVSAALERLSDDRRAILLLRLDHGLAYEDIAGLMGFSLSKVKVELHRARQVLREELSRYQGGSR